MKEDVIVAIAMCIGLVVLWTMLTAVRHVAVPHEQTTVIKVL